MEGRHYDNLVKYLPSADESRVSRVHLRERPRQLSLPVGRGKCFCIQLDYSYFELGLKCFYLEKSHNRSDT